VANVTSAKSTVEQIRERFDRDVERFSSLETGQAAAMDSPLCLELIAAAAAAVCPGAKSVLDIGCGAGNYTLRLLQELPNLDCTLLDLSRPMLERAQRRVGTATTGRVTLVQADIREAEFDGNRFDLVLAAAVLHHLRTPAEWTAVFEKLFRVTRHGGSVFIYDMVEQEHPSIRPVMQRRYGQHLVNLNGEAYRDQVLAYIEQEDSPASQA
jgi:tRNA (cmo5U34)-methyltransferase